MKKIVWASLLAILCSYSLPVWAKRRYRYTLDPAHAEQTLATLHLNAPLSDENWLSVLGTKKFDTYAVQPGDSLWNISGRVVGDPKLWRKLWQENALLTNPHELNVGQVLRFYQEGSKPTFQIPLVRLVPNRPGAVSDLDTDSAINLEVKNQFRPSILVIEDEEILGEVTGSLSKKNWLTDTDDLFIRLEKEGPVEPKKVFSIVREDHTVVDPTKFGRPSLGLLVRLVGEVEVISQHEKILKVELKRHMGELKRGDKVISAREVIRSPAVFFPPEEMQARIVMGEYEDTQLFSQGQVVLINKGEEDGMKPGYLFRVSEVEDPLTEKESTVAPDFKGEVQVVAIGKLASVGLILRNRVPLIVGDTLVAAQIFKDPPLPPRLEAKEIDID